MMDKWRKEEKKTEQDEVLYGLKEEKQQMMMKMGSKVKVLTDGMPSSSSVSWPLQCRRPHFLLFL